MSSRQVSATPQLSSAQKGLQVLETLAEYERSVGVSELARAMGWSRATVHKWLITLVGSGWVEQDPSGLYRLTLRVMRVTKGALTQAGIDDRIFPLLEDLAASCRETVSIAILDVDAALIVQRVESPNVLSINLRLGSRIPLDKTASGAVLVAHSSPETVKRLSESGIALPTQERIQSVLEDGLVVVTDELENEMTAAAMPIHLREAGFLAALSVAAPSRSGIPDKSIAHLRDAQQSIHRLMEGNTLLQPLGA